MNSLFVKSFSSCRWLFLFAVIFINSLHTQAAETYCGSKLGSALDLLCLYGYGTKLKKSGEPMDDYSDRDENMVFSFDKFPFLSSFQENSLAKTRRRRFGISHECCDKPCTVDELRSFCKLYRER